MADGHWRPIYALEFPISLLISCSIYIVMCLCVCVCVCVCEMPTKIIDWMVRLDSVIELSVNEIVLGSSDLDRPYIGLGQQG
jgi:hypothetical protein